MKKSVFITTLCILVTGLVGVWFVRYKINNKNIVMIYQQTDRIFFPESLQDLEEACDIIIQAKVLPGSINVLQTKPKEIFKLGYTRTELEVKNVFAGNVSVGDLITITEEYFTVETLTEIQIYHSENYGPSEEGKEYIFFLKKYTENKPDYLGMYFPLGADRGRYPVVDNLMSESYSKQASFSERTKLHNVYEFTNEQLNLGNRDSTTYREIFDEVLDKYLVEV